MTDHMHDDAQSVGTTEALAKAMEIVEMAASDDYASAHVSACAKKLMHKVEPWPASQPSPAATVETATKSAPPHSASQLAERAPSSDAAPGGADTQCSAGNGDDLLPCPFCGGEADFYENWVDHERKWSVSCGDCNANLDVCEDTKTEAAAHWNVRLRAVPQGARK